MYAGTTVNMYQVKRSTTTPTVAEDTSPLFMCVFSADKGTEKLKEYSYADFISMYGSDVNFNKHGQPLLQAHKILSAGGRVLAKRLVADTATLANVIIKATVVADPIDVTRPDPDDIDPTTHEPKIKQVYIDRLTGKETFDEYTPPESTDPASKNQKLVLQRAKIRYMKTTESKKTSRDDIIAAAEYPGTGTTYPLFAICDNGRGVSVKSVRFTGDYNNSYSANTALYNIIDIENSSTIESARFALDPDAVVSVGGNLKNLALNENTSVQFAPAYLPNGMEAFLKAVATALGWDLTADPTCWEQLYQIDVLFGKSLKGKALDYIVFDTTVDPQHPELNPIDLSNVLGHQLLSGLDWYVPTTPGEDPPTPAPVIFPGSNTPGDNDAWTLQAKNFFNGGFTDEIYDRDLHMIDYCVDANYPVIIKNLIVTLANWRQDFMFFRDLGTKVTCLTDVTNIVESATWLKSPFAADYMTCYDVVDPTSKKQIRVTMTYGLAPLLVTHHTTNIAAPCAGEYNGFIIADYIEGSMTFTPRVTPDIDQKQVLEDLHVNYALIGSTGSLVVQDCMTSQDYEGPLESISNVLVTQSCIKAIRKYTPKIRFMLTDNGDFALYKTLIQSNVIDNYSSYFKEIYLEYTADAEQTARKIFEASLFCYYKDYVKAEIFNVYSFDGSSTTNPYSNLEDAVKL